MTVSGRQIIAVGERCQRLSHHAYFRNGVLALIVISALVMGLETWSGLSARWAVAFAVTHPVVQALFVLELSIRIAAHGRRPLEFFRSGWNLFDFAVVALSLLPVAGPFATVARLARVLRVGQLVTGQPELRLIVGTMLRSIPSMGHVVALLGLLIYIYGVIGHHLFSHADPEHWADLGRAARTLFLVTTLEGWADILKASEAATPWAWAFYFSFIIIAVFVVINLFIAVVISNLENVRREVSGEQPADDAVRDKAIAVELRTLNARIDELIGAAGQRRTGP